MYPRIPELSSARPSAILLALTFMLGVLVFSGARARALDAVATSGRWNGEERSVLASLRLGALAAATPHDPSNAYENSPTAAALGRQLFFDTRFSANGQVACASCHDPSLGFQDGRPVGIGVGVGTRRAMPITEAGRNAWLFWDGRKDSLWSQALGPLEDPKEHGGSRTQYAHLLEQYYRADYEAVFGPLAPLSRVPGKAGPLGSEDEQAAWRMLPADTQHDISRVFANLGKAIAAYERTLSFAPNRVDRYIDQVLSGRSAEPAALSADEVQGLRLFIGKGQCVSCHGGALFSDQQFHNTGVPARSGAAPDRGRAAALLSVKADEFNCLGQFSDARPEECSELRLISDTDATLEGAFRTPSLRGVGARAPYMHAGQIATLDDVVRHYVVAPDAPVGRSELNRVAPEGAGRAPIRLSASEQQALLAFLRAL